MGWDGEMAYDQLGYRESDAQRACVRCCGAFCFVCIGLLSLSYWAHSVPIVSVSDAPPFARSLIWSSLAHHTEAWQSWQSGLAPPPPSFGDGKGNF